MKSANICQTKRVYLPRRGNSHFKLTDNFPKDALMTLRYSVGYSDVEMPWAPWRKTRADVKGNPAAPILAYDASLIFRYASGDISTFPAQFQSPTRGERSRDQFIASPVINLELLDDMIVISADDTTELYGLNLSIELNEYVTFGDIHFNLPESFMSVVHTDDNGMNIGIATAVPENLEGYLVMIPVSVSEDTFLNITVISNIYESQIVMEVFANQLTVDDPILAPVNSVGNNYPNPFNPNTTISYSVKENSLVRILVYNTKGQLVKTLVDEEKVPGNHSVQWNGVDHRGRNVASGVYFYMVSIGDDFRKTQKMMLLK